MPARRTAAKTARKRPGRSEGTAGLQGKKYTHIATVYQRKLAALEALKKSLLHRAFRGEL